MKTLIETHRGQCNLLLVSIAVAVVVAPSDSVTLRGKHGYATNCVRQKDQRCRLSTVTESFGVNRPLLRRKKVGADAIDDALCEQAFRNRIIYTYKSACMGIVACML